MMPPSSGPAGAFDDTFARIGARYDENLKTLGDGPQSTEQRDVASQEQRMRMLAGVGDFREAKVLDFGCGTGHLLTLLKREFGFVGEYVGYDISAGMVSCAQGKHPEARFEVRNVLSEGVGEEFDFVFITGTFNNQTGNNRDWMQECLKKLFGRTRKAIAFNNLSTYVDFFDDGLFYEDPETVFRFCKEQLSPRVTLRHDYCTKEGIVPFEFTTYVYQTDIAPRLRRSIS